MFKPGAQRNCPLSLAALINPRRRNDEGRPQVQSHASDDVETIKTTKNRPHTNMSRQFCDDFPQRPSIGEEEERSSTRHKKEDLAGKISAGLPRT